MELLIEYGKIVDGYVDHTSVVVRCVDVDEVDFDDCFNDPISNFDVPDDLKAQGYQIIGAGY